MTSLITETGDGAIIMEAIPVLLFIAPTWVFAAFYYYTSLRKHLLSPQMATLNENLAKVGLYWSNSEASVLATDANLTSDLILKLIGDLKSTC